MTREKSDTGVGHHCMKSSCEGEAKLVDLITDVRVPVRVFKCKECGHETKR